MAISIALGGVTLLPRAASTKEALGVVYDPYALVKPRLDASTAGSFDASGRFGRPIISPMSGVVFHVVCIDNSTNSVITQTPASRSAIWSAMRGLVPKIRVSICNSDGLSTFYDFAKPDTVKMSASIEVSELRGMSDFVFFDVKFNVTHAWYSDPTKTFSSYHPSKQAHTQYTLMCDFPAITLPFNGYAVALQTLTCPVTFEYRCRHIATQWFTKEGIMKAREIGKKRARDSIESISTSSQSSPMPPMPPFSPVDFEPCAAERTRGRLSMPLPAESALPIEYLGGAYQRARTSGAYQRARTSDRPYPLIEVELRSEPRTIVQMGQEIARSAAKAAAEAAALEARRELHDLVLDPETKAELTKDLFADYLNRDALTW